MYGTPLFKQFYSNQVPYMVHWYQWNQFLESIGLSPSLVIDNKKSIYGNKSILNSTKWYASSIDFPT